MIGWGGLDDLPLPRWGAILAIVTASMLWLATTRSVGYYRRWAGDHTFTALVCVALECLASNAMVGAPTDVATEGRS